jgi:hypothetical protein
MLPDAKKEFDDYINDENLLDELAELEHNGWMKARTDANWERGNRSDYHKTHNCIIPFIELDKDIPVKNDQKEKNKDRDTIKKYTSMLEGSGYAITFLKN